MVPPQHTFLSSLPSPGSLISDWWGRDHLFGLGLMIGGLAVPCTLAFLIASSLVEWRRYLHLFVVFGFFLFSLVVVFFWARDYEAANTPTADNAYNNANDPRWCCVNFALAAQRCVPLTVLNLCNPSPGQADLVVAPMFVYRFWFLVVFMLLLVLDFFVIIKGIFERAVARYYREVRDELMGRRQNEDGDAEEAAAAAAAENPAPSAPPPAGVYNFRVPIPGSTYQDNKGYTCYPPPKGGTASPIASGINMKDQLRAMAARQGSKYQGKNSKR